MREIILRNIDKFKYKEMVIIYLDFSNEKRDMALLNELILIALMDKEGYILTEAELYNEIENMETNIINQSLDEDYIDRTIPKEANRIYSAVLKAAWKK